MVQRLLVGVMIFAGAGLVLSIIGLVLVVAMGRPEASETVHPGPGGALRLASPDVADMGLRVPRFELVDQDGRERTEKLFEGEVTVLDFGFTYCPFACPGMVRAMLEVAEELDGTAVRFVRISVDPQRDTPERLREYAQKNGIDTSRWTFLTGDFDTAQRIAAAMLLAVEVDPSVGIDLPDGSEMQNIIHPTKFILVDRQRRVLGFYEATIEEETAELARRAREVAGGR